MNYFRLHGWLHPYFCSDDLGPWSNNLEKISCAVSIFCRNCAKTQYVSVNNDALNSITLAAAKIHQEMWKYFEIHHSQSSDSSKGLEVNKTILPVRYMCQRYANILAQSRYIVSHFESIENRRTTFTTPPFFILIFESNSCGRTEQCALQHI